MKYFCDQKFFLPNKKMLSDNTNNSQLHSAELSILFDFHADYQLDLFRGKMFVRSDQVPSRENRCCARRSESCVNRERKTTPCDQGRARTVREVPTCKISLGNLNLFAQTVDSVPYSVDINKRARNNFCSNNEDFIGFSDFLFKFRVRENS